jgi:hypothetical protein
VSEDLYRAAALPGTAAEHGLGEAKSRLGKATLRSQRWSAESAAGPGFRPPDSLATTSRARNRPSRQALPKNYATAAELRPASPKKGGGRTRTQLTARLRGRRLENSALLYAHEPWYVQGQDSRRAR